MERSTAELRSAYYIRIAELRSAYYIIL